MTKLQKNKKGFTLVELAVVIAVIAILIAVLVPTFMSLISSAQKSADQQLVKNLNTAITIEDPTNETNVISEALEIAQDNGYTLSKISPTSDGCDIAWDEVSNRFVLMDGDTVVYYDSSATDITNMTLWYITDSTEILTGKNYYYTAADSFTGTITVTSGADLTALTGVTEVVVNAESASGTDVITVVVPSTALVVNNGNSATVNVYGTATTVTTTTTYGNSSLHIYGEVTGKIEVLKGRVVAHTGSTITSVIITASNLSDVKVEAENSSSVKSLGATNESVAAELASNSNISGVSTSVITTTAVSSEFAGGTGTEASPYLIATAEQFKNIGNLSSKMLYGNAYYFLLTNDIDLSSYNNTAFTTYFCGELDGDNHSVYMGQCNVISSGTIYDVTIKNLTVIQTGTYFSPIFNYINGYPVGSSLYVGKEGTVTFENINFESNFSGTHITPSYGYSQFCCWAYGKINFIDCTNYVSYSVSSSTYSYGAYAGLFIGNYINSGNIGSTISFINCVNYGTVSGDHVGFFFGNSSQASGGVILVDSSDYENTDTSHAAIYVSGCANYGTLMGTAKVELAMSLGTSTANDDVNASLMNDSTKFYNAGLMITSNINDMSLSLNNDNQVVVTGSSDSKVASYTVTCGVSIGFKRSDGSSAGSWYFAISETVTDVSSAKINYITKIMLDTDYDSTATEGNTYADLAKAGALTSDQGIEYILVEQSDGSYIAVINSEIAISMFANGAVSMSCGSSPNYRIVCNNSNGISIGGVNYTVAQLEETKSV